MVYWRSIITYSNYNILWTEMIPEIWQDNVELEYNIFKNNICHIHMEHNIILFDFGVSSSYYELKVIDNNRNSKSYIDTIFSKTLFRFIQRQLSSGSSTIVLPLLKEVE